MTPTTPPLTPVADLDLPKALHQIDIYHDDGTVTSIDGYTAEQVRDAIAASRRAAEVPPRVTEGTWDSLTAAHKQYQETAQRTADMRKRLDLDAAVSSLPDVAMPERTRVLEEVAAPERSDTPADTCAEMRARCSACGGTGEVHDLTGEWRGSCDCAASKALDAAAPAGLDWQPIETAPKGARGYAWMMLMWGSEDDPNTGLGMRWGDKFFACGTFYCMGKERQYEFREIEVKPTHWMPKPIIPRIDGDKQGAQGDAS